MGSGKEEIYRKALEQIAKVEGHTQPSREARIAQEALLALPEPTTLEPCDCMFCKEPR